MILMRISKVPGICDIKKYDVDAGKDGGWFPITSINYDFDPKGNESESGGGTGTAPAAGTQNKTGKDSASKSSQVSVTKTVDMASVPIMTLAMQDRDKVAKKESLSADVHFLGSVSVQGSGDHNTFTFIRIHLDGIEIKSWKLNGSGEGRWTETIEIGYERSAMCYESTDGSTVLPKFTGGWDQTKNEKWIPKTKFFPDFPR